MGGRVEGWRMGGREDGRKGGREEGRKWMLKRGKGEYLGPTCP